MQEDTIIQKNLFAIDNENNEQKEITKIPEDLSLEDLKKESQKRPRKRKNSTNLINKFKNDFEILSVLRNLKIIGIFTRLALRDRKKNYLRFIPYTWQLIYMRIDQNRTFIDLKNLLSQNFKEIK